MCSAVHIARDFDKVFFFIIITILIIFNICLVKRVGLGQSLPFLITLGLLITCWDHVLSWVTILNEDVLLLLLNYSANYTKHLAANLTPNLRTLLLTNCKTLVQGKLCLYIFQCLCNTIVTISFQIFFLTLPMLQLALLLK